MKASGLQDLLYEDPEMKASGLRCCGKTLDEGLRPAAPWEDPEMKASDLQRRGKILGCSHLTDKEHKTGGKMETSVWLC